MSEIAHLGPVELLTPKGEESERFFVDVLGMEVEGREGQSVYLRGAGGSNALGSSDASGAPEQAGNVHPERRHACLDARRVCSRGETLTLAVDPSTVHFFDPETEIALS